MTTIATDGKTVAADTNVTYGSLRSAGNDAKIFKVGSEIIGCSGSSSDCGVYVDWCKAGRDEDSTPEVTEDKFYALHVSKTGVFLVTSGKYLTKVQVNPPFAIGSGDDFAFGAMWAGLSPRDAVEVVKKYTMCAGGNITELKV